MPLFEVETTSHIMIACVADSEAARAFAATHYPSEEVIRISHRPRDAWVISKKPLGIQAEGDPGSIARVARILVDNALRFAPQGSEVRISAGRDASAAGIVVADEGPGIPADEREVVFERFRRGSDTGGGGGFGLGLAIGRELAERMGGRLVLEPSETGARFALRLPRAAVPETPESGLESGLMTAKSRPNSA